MNGSFLLRTSVMCVRLCTKYYHDLNISTKKIGVEIRVFISIKHNNKLLRQLNTSYAITISILIIHRQC